MSYDITPATRCEIFTEIAIAVTRHGLSEPVGLSFGRNYLFIYFDGRDELNAWANHLGAIDEPDIMTDDGKLRAINATARYRGWRLWLKAIEPMQSVDVSAATR